jgi:hypothetical protein
MNPFHRTPGIGFLILFIICILSGCRSSGDNSQYFGTDPAEIDQELSSLLQTWYPRIIDTIHGGYWTNFENDWTLSEDQEKMVVSRPGDYGLLPGRLKLFLIIPYTEKLLIMVISFLQGVCGMQKTVDFTSITILTRP